MRYALRMPRRFRLRTFAARASLALLLALTPIWLGSAWVWVSLPLTWTDAIAFRSGQVWLVRTSQLGIDPRPPSSSGPPWRGLIDMTLWHESSSALAVTAIPLWVFIAPLALTTALLWRSEFAARRRDHPSRCPRCGYDNAATPTNSPCPECGSPAPHTPATTTHSAPPTA